MPSAFPAGSTTLTCDHLGEIAWAAIGNPSAELLNAHISQPMAIGESVYDFFNENRHLSMPCRFYGGAADAVVPQWSSITLPEEHQRLQGSVLSTGVAVDSGMAITRERAGNPGATHRSTFLASLFHPGLNVRRWFDEAL